MNSIGAIFIALFLNSPAPSASLSAEKRITASVEVSFEGQTDELAGYEENLFLAGDAAPDDLSDY